MSSSRQSHCIIKFTWSKLMKFTHQVNLMNFTNQVNQIRVASENHLSLLAEVVRETGQQQTFSRPSLFACLWCAPILQ